MVACSFIVKSGAPQATIKEQVVPLSYPHDIIKFFNDPATSNYAPFNQLYADGLSLRQISEVTGEAKTTIRKVLVLNKVELRSNRNTQKDGLIKPRQALFGGILYGYCALDGKLVIDPKEIKIVRKILIQHQKGMSFNAISRWLNNQNIPSKMGKRWSDVSIASVIRKHLIIKSEGIKNG